MTITDAQQVWPELSPRASEQDRRMLEQMIDQGDACRRSLPFRVEFTDLIETKTGRVFLVTTGK